MKKWKITFWEGEEARRGLDVSRPQLVWGDVELGDFVEVGMILRFMIPVY
jgi:hypothetical protein